MNTKVIAPFLVIAVALIVAAVIVATPARLQPFQAERVSQTVRVLEADPKSVRMVVHSQGTVAPRTETALVPEVSGNIVWISPNLIAGGYFEAGDPLLKIDNRDYVTAVDRARAAINRAEAEQEFSEFELQRLKELETRELISRSEVEAGIRIARVAEANLQEARASLQQTERDLTRTEIRAPFKGFVRNEQADIGQFVSRGTAIANIYAIDFLEVRLPIADQQLAYLDLPLSQRGELATARAPSVRLSADFAGQKYSWMGTVVRTEAEIDSSSRMVYAVARVIVDNTETDAPETVAPPVGLFVNAEIQGRPADNIIVLPRAAIRNASEVLVVDNDNRLRFRTVELLRIYGNEAFISGGIQKGELINLSPLQAVVNGMRVEPLLDSGQRSLP
ncbi:MAG: efflux RND transporter periplasmic adaptor subunit [Candidatus Rariloculaceae bacterium]